MLRVSAPLLQTLLCIVALALAGCQASPSFTPAQDSGWHRFYWGNFTIVTALGPERALMVLPVKIGERLCPAQLDTGLPSMYRWSGESGNESGTLQVELSALGRTHKTLLTTAQFEAAKNCSNQSPLLVIGNGFFDSGVLEIDFPKEQMRYSAQSNKNRRGIPFDYVSPTGNGGYIVVPTKLAGENSARRMMLDTGAARFGYSLFDISELTRIAGADASLRTFEVGAWNAMIPCRETTNTVAVEFSDSLPMKMRASHCASNFTPPQGVKGLIGLGAFSEKVRLIIDYPARRLMFENNN